MEVNLEEKKATINAGPASLPKEASHFIIYVILLFIFLGGYHQSHNWFRGFFFNRLI